MIFYDSFYQAIQQLKTPEERLQAYEILTGYGCAGKEPPEGMSEKVSIIWAMSKSLIDASEKKRRDGAKGGRPSNAEVKQRSNKFVNFRQSDTDWDAIQRAMLK